MPFDTTSWSSADKAYFLAVLAHELTVSARGTYEVGTDGVLQPEALRAFNEMEHRVTGSVRDHLRGIAGMPLEAVLEMLMDFGARHNQMAAIQYAISHAQELTLAHADIVALTLRCSH
jgi:hypothetical protein